MFYRQCLLQSSRHQMLIVLLSYGMECRIRPMFIIIPIAAEVTDRPFKICKESYLQERADRTDDQI